MWEKAGKNGDNLVIFERISGRGRPLITMLSMSVGNLGGKFSKYRQTKLRQACCRAEHGRSHGCGGDVKVKTSRKRQKSRPKTPQLWTQS